jgi:DNA-binding NtrC family response regulator
MAPHAPFDVAILDFNLGSGSDSTPVAQIIAGRRLPFLFASGYVSSVVPEAFKDRPMLRKPFQVDQLDRAIRQALTQV